MQSKQPQQSIIIVNNVIQFIPIQHSNKQVAFKDFAVVSILDSFECEWNNSLKMNEMIT